MTNYGPTTPLFKYLSFTTSSQLSDIKKGERRGTPAAAVTVSLQIISHFHCNIGVDLWEEGGG